MEETGKEILQELREIKELLRIIASNTEQKDSYNIVDVAHELKKLTDKNFGKN